MFEIVDIPLLIDSSGSRALKVAKRKKKFMARRKIDELDSETQCGRPALSPEAEEKRLVALAYNEVEQRILNHTATSAEIVHFLKLGTKKSRLEEEKLELEKKLVEAKTNALKAAEVSERMFAEAISAMKSYQGREYVEEEDVL